MLKITPKFNKRTCPLYELEGIHLALVGTCSLRFSFVHMTVRTPPYLTPLIIKDILNLVSGE